MKLIGSLAEGLLREQLLRSNAALNDGADDPLVDALRAETTNVADAFVLDWIAGQGEDIYTVLVSADEIVVVEVPRYDGEVLVERKTLADYRRGCKKSARIKIAVALDLMSSRARAAGAAPTTADS